MKQVQVVVWCVGLVLAAPSISAAQQRQVELGSSLVSLTAGLGDNNTNVFGIPSSGFGLVNPGVYAALFLGPNTAFEPQLGLIAVSGEGESIHFVHVAAQFDYFTNGTEAPSPFLFGSLGVLDSSGADSAASLSVGVGYRMPLDDRLAFRADIRLTHLGEGLGNTLTLQLAMGGLFGRR